MVRVSKTSRRVKFSKRLRKLVEMAKNMARKGKSVKNGNSPSPYTKYKKTPYKYSTNYYNWKIDAMRGRVRDVRAHQ